MCWSNATKNTGHIWCFDAMIFFATFLVFFINPVLLCKAIQYNTCNQFDLLQSNFLIEVLWNYMLFDRNVTLFFN